MSTGLRGLGRWGLVTNQIVPRILWSRTLKKGQMSLPCSEAPVCPSASVPTTEHWHLLVMPQLSSCLNREPLERVSIFFMSVLKPSAGGICRCSRNTLWINEWMDGSMDGWILQTQAIVSYLASWRHRMAFPMDTETSGRGLRGPLFTGSW